MTPVDAAAILHVHPDAPVEEIERAYRASARASHPDRLPHTATASTVSAAAHQFGRVTEARQTLLLYASSHVTATTTPLLPSDDIRPVQQGAFVPAPGWRAVLVWSVVLGGAIVVSFLGGPMAFSNWDLFLRLLPLAVTSIAFALTGTRAYFLASLVFGGASVFLTFAYASFGSLLALEILLVPLIGLSVVGSRKRRALPRTQHPNRR